VLLYTQSSGGYRPWCCAVVVQTDAWVGVHRSQSGLLTEIMASLHLRFFASALLLLPFRPPFARLSAADGLGPVVCCVQRPSHHSPEPPDTPATPDSPPPPSSAHLASPQDSVDTIRSLTLGISAHQKLDLLAGLVRLLGYEAVAVFGDCFDGASGPGP
jgi:hypothetical protein